MKNTSYTLRHIPLELMARIKAEATIKGETIEQTILRVVARGLDDG